MEEAKVLENVNVVELVDETGIVDIVESSKNGLTKGGKTALVVAGVAAAVGITALIVKKFKKKKQETPIDVTPIKEVHDGESIVEDIIEE